MGSITKQEKLKTQTACETTVPQAVFFQQKNERI